MQKSRQEILHQNRQILDNISQSNIEARQNTIRAKGHVLLADAKAQGFKKIGWDVYQRPQDIDHGHIWSLEEIDGDKWLVCYTDANDHILRNLATDASNYYRMEKVAHKITEPIIGYGLKPGDLVEITPRQFQSINFKYAGMKGIVTSALPDRSELTFEDGSAMWVENKDLTPVTDSKELQVGDSVRMFSKNISGKIIKISRDGKYVAFKNATTGQEFAVRKEDIVKEGLVFIHSNPDNPDENRVIKDMMKQVYQGQPGNVPSAGSPESNVPATNPMGLGGQKPEAGPAVGQPMGMPPAKKDMPPPAIKQMPSLQELDAGTAVAAGSFASNLRISKLSRRMNFGDQVQSKSTGRKGTLVDISFDRKLGKFYRVDFGGGQPEQVFETDLMKVKATATNEPPAFPTDVSPGPHRFLGAKRAILDPKYDNLKTSALDFVSGMVSQALTNHETEFPGSKLAPQLEDAIAKQAVTTFMTKYLPEEYRQAMGSEDKDELSQWLLFETAGTKEDAPTAQEFVPDQNTAVPAETPQMRTQSLALGKVQAHLNSHIKVERYSPTKFASPIEKNRFVHQAAMQLTDVGIELPVAHYMAQNIISQGNTDNALLRHTLAKYFVYEPQVVNQLIDEAAFKLANAVFTTTKGVKYALDLPGMETLRGGGGGYPGGLNIDPMKWEVKNPKTPDADNSALESALSEQLSDQSKPFEEAAPKLDIKLDTENKQIIIDYNQDEGPAMPLEGTELPPPGQELPNKPSAAGPTSPQGQKPTPGGNEAAGDFSKMDIPVNF